MIMDKDPLPGLIVAVIAAALVITIVHGIFWHWILFAVAVTVTLVLCGRLSR